MLHTFFDASSIAEKVVVIGVGVSIAVIIVMMAVRLTAWWVVRSSFSTHDTRLFVLAKLGRASTDIGSDCLVRLEQSTTPGNITLDRAWPALVEVAGVPGQKLESQCLKRAGEVFVESLSRMPPAKRVDTLLRVWHVLRE